MKFNIKRLTSVVLLAVMIASAFAFTSCNVINEIIGGEKPDNGGSKKPDGPSSFIMEAEYVDFTGLVGGGHSNEQYEEMMIYGNGSDAEKELGWSNGYFVSATHKEGIRLTFEFTADKAVENATIVLRLGSEMGNLNFTPDDFEVSLNGEAIDYEPMYLTSSARLEDMKFVDKTVTNEANIKAGKNVLTLTVLANTLAGGTTAGPIIDCVKITSGAKLEWNPLTDNPEKREEGI